LQFDDIQLMTQLRWAGDLQRDQKGQAYLGLFSNPEQPQRVVWTAVPENMTDSASLAKLEASTKSIPSTTLIDNSGTASVVDM
jgi:hypothetical protein